MKTRTRRSKWSTSVRTIRRRPADRTPRRAAPRLTRRAGGRQGWAARLARATWTPAALASGRAAARPTTSRPRRAPATAGLRSGVAAACGAGRRAGREAGGPGRCSEAEAARWAPVTGRSATSGLRGSAARPLRRRVSPRALCAAASRRAPADGAGAREQVILYVTLSGMAPFNQPTVERKFAHIKKAEYAFPVTAPSR